MDRKYWAHIGHKQPIFASGARATREDAVAACEQFLASKPEAWRKRNRWRKFTITSGYGEFGLHFDLKFFDLYPSV